MGRSLKICLSSPTAVSVHQWRNFGEDVFRELRETCEVSIEEIDGSTEEFFLRGVRKRQLRATAARVREIAERNLMAQVVVISEIPDVTSG